MPILLLESGSLLFPSTECHTIGVEGEYGLGGRDGGGGGGRYGDDDTSVSDQSMSTLPSITSHHHFPPADHRRMSMSPPRSANMMATAISSGNGPTAPGNSYGHLSFMAQPHTTAQGIPLPGHGMPFHSGDSVAQSSSMASGVRSPARGGGGAGRRRSDASVITKYSEDYNTFVAQYAAKYHQPKAVAAAVGGSGVGGGIGGVGKKVAAGAATIEKKPRVGLYRLRAVFERETTFLKIPFSHFEKILDDSRLIVRSMADGKCVFEVGIAAACALISIDGCVFVTVIKRQLQRSNDTIVKRITSLLPWLNGKLTLRPGTVNPIAEEDEQANKAKDQDIDTTDTPAMYVVVTDGSLSSN